VIFDGQPIGESNPLNVEVWLDADDLFSECDLVRALPECRTKNRRELPNHATRRDRRVVRELGYRAE
jgi:hypothetical protein